MRRLLGGFDGVLVVTVINACGRPQVAVSSVSGDLTITMHAAPEHPYIETMGDQRLVNFQLRLRNGHPQPMRIAQYTLSVYDSRHELVMRRALDSNAFAPSIAILGSTVIASGETVDLFNPLSSFALDVPLDALMVSLCVQHEGTPTERERNHHRLPGDCDEHVDIDVVPIDEQRGTAFALPLHGRITVWDGHEVLSHHVRVPLDDPRVAREGLVANSNQFAEDFIYTDDHGAAYAGDPRQLSNWFSYGKPIFAPADGVVVGVANGVPENRFADSHATRIVSPPGVETVDPKGMGNFVVIDHGDRRFSVLLHMQPGSVTVARGAHVTRGEKLGVVGFSGDAIFPHLHYTVMDGPEPGTAWGVPSYFASFAKIRGANRTIVTTGAVGTGDIVEAIESPNDH